jgi:hypothetical protein
MLKINASIEILDCSHISTLNTNLTKDFCIYLGDSRTLRYISLANCGHLSHSSIQYVGKAIAFNHKKGYVLEYVNL